MEKLMKKYKIKTSATTITHYIVDATTPIEAQHAFESGIEKDEHSYMSYQKRGKEVIDDIQDMDAKDYTSTITVTFGGNKLQAESKEEYLELLKENFLDKYGIELQDDEITIHGDIREGGWKPMESKDGCAWFGGKTHSILADYLPEEALEHNHEDLDFLVTAWRKA